MTITPYTNYINFDPNWFNPSLERVAFVEKVDERYVSGFKWSYTDKKKLPFRMRVDRFIAAYIVSPVQ